MGGGIGGSMRAFATGGGGAWMGVGEGVGVGIVLGRRGLLGTGMPLVCGWSVSVFVLWMMW